MKYTRFVPLLLVSALVFGGCQLGQQIQQKAVDTAMTAAADAMFQGIDDPMLKKHFIAQFSQRKYRVTTETGTKAGGGSVTEMDFSDTSSIKMHTMVTAGGKTLSDMIILGDTTYVKNEKDGVWWKQVNKKTADASPTTDALKFDPEEMKKDFEEKKASTAYKSLGQEACGSLNCYKYEESHTDDTKSIRTFWFDDKDFLLRKEETSYGATKTTTSYVYDNINVTEPSPVRDVPEGKSVYEMMYSVPAMGSTGSTSPSGSDQKMPSQEEIDAMMQQYGGDQ